MKTRRTERQLIEAIKSEVRGAIEELGYYDSTVVSMMLNKRYQPTKILTALGELNLERQASLVIQKGSRLACASENLR